VGSSPLRRPSAAGTLRAAPMKRLLPPLALLPLFALFNFIACSDDGTSTGTTGADPDLAICNQAPLCDPLVLPSVCKDNGVSFDCTAPDGGAPDGGAMDDAGALDGGADGSSLSPLQAGRLQCALEALRDRGKGGLATLVAYKGSKTCGTRIEIVSFGDGSASVLPVYYCDTDVERGKSARRQIQPVAFFEECLASTDETKRLQCLAEAMTEKAASGGSCSCRGIHADQFRGRCSSE
jgi:hypothetical protein